MMQFDPEFRPPPVPLKGGKPIDHEALFARVLQRSKVSSQLSSKPVINLQLEFTRDGKPFIGGYLHWSTADGIHLSVNGNRVLGRSGRAVVSLDPGQVNGHGYVRLNLESDGLSLEFPEIWIESSTIRTYKTSEGIDLKVAGPEARLPMIENVGRGKKRFDIALSGSVEQLEVCLPGFRSIKCFRVKRLFLVPDKGKRRGIFSKIKTSPLDKTAVEDLKGIDLLFDFSGSPIILELARKQHSGKSTMRTIVAPDCSHLAFKSDTLFERLTSDSPF